MADQAFLGSTMAHLDVVWSISRRSNADPAAAEDLVQETYGRAWAGFAAKGEGDVRSWLVAICLNAARSERRRGLRRPQIATDLDGVPDTIGRHDVSAGATWATTSLGAGPVEPTAVAAVLHADDDPSPAASMVVEGKTVAFVRTFSTGPR